MARADDYYALLGVTPDASDDEIRKAFRERVRACHPDRVATLDEDLRLLAKEKMVALNEAYAVLRSRSRRTAYDERQRAPFANDALDVVTRSDEPATPPGATPTESATSHRQPGTRRRIGEQQFVTRAASEEFEHTVKRCVAGSGWAPTAFPGATFALHGRRGRSNLYYALLAEPHLDPRQLQHFLQALRSFTQKLGNGLFSRSRVFGFAAAVTFAEQARQRRILERFNRSAAGTGPLRPATFIDLVNWHVVPGETSLQERLEGLQRGS